MHLEETYTGIMRVASNRDGKPYKDWREYYVDQSGLIMIFQSDSKPGKYAVYFFCCQMNTCTHRAVNCKFRMGRFELKQSGAFMSLKKIRNV